MTSIAEYNKMRYISQYCVCCVCNKFVINRYITGGILLNDGIRYYCPRCFVMLYPFMRLIGILTKTLKRVNHFGVRNGEPFLVERKKRIYERPRIR